MTITLDHLSWVLAGISLIGNYFVIKKNVLGQWIWMVGNIGWIGMDLWKGLEAQAFLFAVYTGMCIWGIILWSREAKDAAKGGTA